MTDERFRLAQRPGQERFLWFDKQTVPDTGMGTLDETTLETMTERGRKV